MGSKTHMHSPPPSGSLRWTFPPTGGGTLQGFRDGGLEFFQSDSMSQMVREVIQNSLDAHDQALRNRPVIVRMRDLDVPTGMVGGGSLAKHVKSSISSARDDSDDDAVEFYEEALEMLGKPSIPALAITDENTTGVCNNKWEKLVYKEGTSNKEGQGAAGGSFGIGKNAPFAVSKLRLVCYSTLQSKGQARFVAKCKLVSHRNPDDSKEELQHIGYGNHDPRDVRAPVRGGDIPVPFALARNGCGVFVMGIDKESWKEEVKMSVVHNFFVAMHDGKLEVLVDDEWINQKTLEKFHFDDHMNRYYYEIIKSKKPLRIKGQFGSFDLGVIHGEKNMRNCVAYINRRGMLITDSKSRRSNPFHPRIGAGNFAAVIRAADDETDELVRKMEPPTHGAIETGRLKGDLHKRLTPQLKSIRDRIIGHIEKELNMDATNSADLSELAGVLPDVSGYDTPSKNTAGARFKETIERVKTPIPVHRPPKRGEKGHGAEGGGRKRARKSTAGRHPAATGPDRMPTEYVMNDASMLRCDYVLRMSFAMKQRAAKFEIRPAGEEAKQENAIQILQVSGVSGHDLAKLNDDNTIEVTREDGSEQTIIDVVIRQEEPYTSYEIVRIGDGGESR